MNHTSPATHTRIFRVFSALLLSYLIIVMPFAQMAAAARRDLGGTSQKSEGRQQKAEAKPGSAKATAEDLFVNPPAMPAIGITSTKKDTYAAQPGPALPGDTVTYTVDVNNPTGNDATGVTFNDIIDPNTTRFGADFDLKVSPVAINDTYSVEKGSILSVPAGQGVLANDSGLPAPTAVPIAAGPTTQGGTVTLNADGSFSYTTPNAAFTGPDTFTYTATNGQTSPSPGVDDLATVTINVDAAPTVTSTTPANGATDKATNIPITVTFSESVSATNTAFKIECPTGTPVTFAQSASPATTFTLTPTSNLPAGVTCTVTVVKDQISDTDTFDPPDNMAADYVFSFTTDAPPSVLTTTPINGATPVAANTNITINFSEPVTAVGSAFTIECPIGTGKTFTLSGSGTSTLTLDPTADLPVGTTCTVTVTGSGIHDTDTNDPPDTMTGNYIFSFTIDSPPSVQSTTPTNNATNQASNTDVTLTFSESVSLTAAPVTITCTTSGAHNAYSVSASPNTVFTINPSVDFTQGETCTVTVLANQVTDTDSADPPDNMTANYVFSFSIDAEPTVTATTPTNLATKVANNTNVTITFSEPMDVTGSWFTISGATSGAHTATVSGGSTTFTLDPDTDFTNGEVVTVTVVAAQVSDQDTNDPPDHLAANYVFSFTIDVPPTVTTTTPTNSSLSNLKSTNVTINFSENVGVTAGGVTINCGAGNVTFSGLPQTNVNQIVLDPTSDLPPGSTCTVTVLSANVTDTDLGDPPNNLDGDNNGSEGGDYVFTFGVAPDANADAYNATGNIGIVIAANGVLANDVGTAAVVDRVGPTTANNVVPNGGSFTSATSQAGSVTLGSDGSFTYVPPVGKATGTDTFKYRITNSGGSSTDGTVTITVNDIVWFICNGCGGTNIGTLQNPYTSIASFSAANALGNANTPADNQKVFIRSGTYNASTDKLTLRAGQLVSGQGQAATSFFTPISPAPAAYAALTAGSRPIIAPTTVDAVLVNNGNTISYFDIGNSSSPTGNKLLTGPTTGNWSLTASNMSVVGRGTAIDLSTAAGSAVTLTATFDAVGSSNSTGKGISLTRVNGTLTINNVGSLSAFTNVSGDDFFMDTGTATVSYSGTITNTAAHAVNIANKSGGTVTFSGAISDTGGTGILLTTNTSATLSFSGGITLNGTGAVFAATGGGTVNVTGTNTIGSTTPATGPALNIANTTIGGSGVTFRSISATGGVNGINLTNTGSTAGLTVAGNSSGSCGGSITVQPLGTLSTANAPVTGDCTGGTIQTTTGHGIVLSNTKNVSLTRMLIQNAANGFDEINAQTVNGLTIDHSFITDNAGVGGDRGLEIGDFTTGTVVNGTVTVSNSTIGPTAHDNVGIGIASGTSTWNFTNDVLTGSTLDSGMNFEVRNATVTAFTMDGCIVKNQFADGMQINPASGVNATISNATIQNSSFTTNNIHLDLNHDGTGTSTYKVLNNTFISAVANTINFFSSSVQAPGTGGVLNGRFVNNRIGSNAIANSGGGVGIRINMNGGAAGRVLVDQNVIRQVKDGRGIEIISRNGTGGLDATVTSNDVSAPINTLGAFAQLAAIFLQSNCVTVCNTLRSDIRSNTVPSSPATDGEFANGMLQIVRSGASTNQLVDNAPASPDAASELASHNTGSTAVTGTVTLIAGPINTPPLFFARGGIESAIHSSSQFANLLWPSFDVENSSSNISTSPVEANDSLTQSQLDNLVASAVRHWAATGLTAQQLETLRTVSFEVTDLHGQYLGESGDNRVLIDRRAAGRGWFVDTTPEDSAEFGNAVSATRRYTDPMSAPAGHVDLLTAIEHEIGHKLGLDDRYAEADRDSIMYGYLTVGERRLPALGEAANAKPDSLTTPHFLKLRSTEGRRQKAEGRNNHALNTKSGVRSLKSEVSNSKLETRNSKLSATLTPASGETLNYSIGTLPAGKHVRLTFKVTVDLTFTGNNVANQGTVTGTLNLNPINVSTDDPDTVALNDVTLTPVLGPANANDDNYSAFKNATLNVAAPGVLANDTNVTSVTAGTGTGPCVLATPCATTNGSVTLNSDGSFSYTPTAGYTGGDSFTYVATGNGVDTATVNITVLDSSAIYVNEVNFNPDATGTNEYIELRGVASSTIPAGTYFVVVDGNSGNTGDVKTIINLSGLTFGSNGYLVLLQNGNTYTTAAGATVVTSTTTGFGGLPGGIWSADSAATNIENDGATFMVIQTGTVPTLTDDIDGNNDATPDGAVYAGWIVLDSVGYLTGGDSNDRSYGSINFITSASGTATPSTTVVTPGFITVYVGRICDSTGSAAADWVASGTLGGSAPNWKLGTSTAPTTLATVPLDHIGATNFANSAPVNSVPGATQNVNEEATLTFNSGNSNLISVSDSDAGLNNVQVALTVSNGALTLNGTTGLSFSFSDGNGTGAGDGTADAAMTFRGTLTDVNTALNGMTYTPTSNYNGSDSLGITTNDLGNSACGGALTDTDSVNISVNGVNDAPLLDNTGNMSLTAIPQNVPDVSNPGDLVSAIIAGAGGDRITDVDTGAVEGIAVTAVDNTNGAWQFSTNGGGVWTPFGSPSSTTARLLAADANTRIRFKPNAAFSGTVDPGITFRAWDQTSGSNGGTADTSTNGGTTAFSTATETASITVASTVGVQNATTPEPASGTSQMLFVVSLNAPAGASGASVQYTTADQAPAVGHAVGGTCGNPGVDYQSVSVAQTLSFATGEQFKTIPVTICSDGTSEPDETFLLNLSSPTNATLDPSHTQAVGTITFANTAGTLVISELRTSGPGGLGDDFVELYNNTDSLLTVTASDASAGYGLFKMGTDCNAVPILIATIPNGTVIPARGHYLIVGSQYSLANYGGAGAAAGDQTLTSDIESDRNVAVFSTSNIVNISSANRLDAVGFGINFNSGGTLNGVCDLLREGSNLPAASGSALEYSFFRKLLTGTPQDTNNNLADFMFADTLGSSTPMGQQLGAPGPENKTSPIKRDPSVTVLVLDSGVSPSGVPNRFRDPTPNTPNATVGAFGTLSFRQRIQNNTGAAVTKLRFRIINVTTLPPGPGDADLRTITSSDVSVSNIHDTTTCVDRTAGTASNCTVTVKGTLLEQPPNQTIGGGYNSTISVDLSNLNPATPNAGKLVAGQSVEVQFQLGVQQTGHFRFFIIVEALP